MAFNNDFENWNGRIFIEKKKENEVPKMDVVGISPIKVATEQRGDVLTKIVSYAPYSLPQVSLSVNPSILEVGQLATLNFTGKVVAGSEPVSAVTVVPAVSDLLNNAGAVSFSLVGGSNTTGIQHVHTLTARDGLGKTSSASAGVQVLHRYFIGRIQRNTVGFVAQEGRLGGSIKAAFPGFNTYRIPEGQFHLAWLLPAGEGASLPTPKGTNGLPWEITAVGQLILNNAHGLAVTYDLLRTVNYYTGAADIELTL